MCIHRNDAGAFGGRTAALGVLLAMSLFSAPTSAQQQEVLTFEGKGGSPIRITNEKGEVQEEITEKQLERIIVKLKPRIPQQFEEQGQEPRSVAPQTTRISTKSDPTIDEMLKTRRQNLKMRKARADNPPRKRRKR
jgi:hypothetical protein